MADEWDQYLAPETDEWDQYAVAVKPSGATRSFAPEDLAKQAMDEERRSKSATLSNVLPDIARIGKDAWEMVTSPVQTLKGAYGLVKGAAQTAARDVAGVMGIDEAQTRPNTPEETAFMTMMEPVTQSIMEPETIIPRLSKYTEERPVMSLLNASLLTSGAGKAAEAMGAADTGAMIGGVGAALNPVSIAAKGATTVGKPAVKIAGKMAKETIGALTGRGPGFIEEMSRGTEAAAKAMKGEITGEEIVGHAKDALQKLRDMRSDEYVSKLEKVRANPEELQGVASDLNRTVERLASPDRFDLGITVDESGKMAVDFSKSTIVEHQAVVRRALEDINGWTDNSAAGLDTLKKRLSTYIDQSGRDTPANALITQLEKNLSGGLKKAVPEYEEMTKGYREASSLIKDIESNLMLRKEGMTGRITADQTLRRLSSSLRENFEMRKDLLRALGNESGMDIPAELAGYLAQQWLPAGATGKLFTGGLGVLNRFNPAMWPVLAAGSPRIVGEFLNTFGKARNKVGAMVEKLKPSAPTGPLEGPPPEASPTRGFRGNERLGQPAIDYTPFIDTTPRLRAPYEYPPELPPGQGWTTPDQKVLRAPYETPLQLEGQGFTLPEGLPYPPVPSKTIRMPYEPTDIPPGPRPGTEPPVPVFGKAASRRGANRAKGPENLVTWLERQGGVVPGADYNSRELRQFTDLKRVSRNQSKMQWDEAADLANSEGFVPLDGQPWTGDSLYEAIKSGQGRKILAPDKMDDIMARQIRREVNDWEREQESLAAEGIDSGTIQANRKGIMADIAAEDGAKAGGFTEEEIAAALGDWFEEAGKGRVSEPGAKWISERGGGEAFESSASELPRKYEPEGKAWEPNYSGEDAPPPSASRPTNHAKIIRAVPDRPWEWTADDLIDLRPSERSKKLEGIWGPDAEYERWLDGEGLNKRRFDVGLIDDLAADLDVAVAESDAVAVDYLLKKIQGFLKPQDYYAYEKVQNAGRKPSISRNEGSAKSGEVSTARRTGLSAEPSRYHQESIPEVSSNEGLALTPPEGTVGRYPTRSSSPPSSEQLALFEKRRQYFQENGTLEGFSEADTFNLSNPETEIGRPQSWESGPKTQGMTFREAQDLFKKHR